MKTTKTSMTHSDQKSEKLFNAITDIQDDYILEASAHTFQKQAAARKRFTPRFAFRYAAPIAAALCLSVLMGIFFWPAPVATSAYALVEAKYPDMAPYPHEADFYDEDGNWDDEAYMLEYDAWLTDQKAQERPAGYADGIESFITSSAQQFLSGNENENHVYSPLNIYLALGMLAEITDGSSRQQILSALGSDTLEPLRRQASDVWNASYNNDGFYTSILSSSLWLNEDLPVNKDTLQTLADTYYASSFSGPMGSRKFDKALRSWMNESTGNLLEDPVSDLEFTHTTVLSIATAISYSTSWINEFAASKTASATFHAAAGNITCDFMNQSTVRDYYWGENFSAVAQSEAEGGHMLFILPDEGTSPNDLLEDSETMDFIFSEMTGGTWKNTGSYLVNFSVPKFDVSSNINLADGLQQLGITDVFDSTTADFSPLTDLSKELELELSTISHSARVAIDEQGYQAAAYTIMSVTASAAEPDCDEVDFVLDRPFLFVTLNPDGLPMFIGIVNQPAQ